LPRDSCQYPDPRLKQSHAQRPAQPHRNGHHALDIDSGAVEGRGCRRDVVRGGAPQVPTPNARQLAICGEHASVRPHVACVAPEGAEPGVPLYVVRTVQELGRLVEEVLSRLQSYMVV
jgi:hypothetical protein